MLRPASFSLALLALGLSGCSGFGRFLGDSFQPPGNNPAEPAGLSENMLRVEAKPVPTVPLEVDTGNVWPGPPQPFPTLGQVEKETQNGQIVLPGSGPEVGGGGANAAGPAEAPGGLGGGAKFRMQSNPNAASTIVIPNGNGTSTVIAPDGSVRVIPTPKSGDGK